MILVCTHGAIAEKDSIDCLQRFDIWWCFVSYLNGWVATRVEDLSGLDTGDGRHLKRRRRSGDVGVERRASEGVGGACSGVSVEEINAVRERNMRCK